MLPIQLAIQTQEATADRVVTTAEAHQMMTTIFGSVIGAMVIAFGIVMFSRVIGGNPGNPGVMTGDIIARAGLKEYEYRWFPAPEEERIPRMYAYARRKWVGAYEIVMTRTDDACMIRLYEHLERGRRRLQATWSGMGKEECSRKFEEVVNVIAQVRFEQKTALMRR